MFAGIAGERADGFGLAPSFRGKPEALMTGLYVAKYCVLRSYIAPEFIAAHFQEVVTRKEEIWRLETIRQETYRVHT